MIEAKKQAHAPYEQVRAIDAQAKMKGNRDRTPEEQARIADLNNAQKAIYDEAFARSARTLDTNDQNAAGVSQRLALRRAESGSNDLGGSVSQAIQPDTLAPGLRNEGGTSSGLTSIETGMSPSKSINSATADLPPAYQIGADARDANADVISSEAGRRAGGVPDPADAAASADADRAAALPPPRPILWNLIRYSP